jgi:ParB/RepB/Spo0J family partition protein
MSTITETKEINLESIVLLGSNPRKKINQDALQELAESIKANGLLQPILVSLIPNQENVEYFLIYGERRYRASKLAGLETIRAEIREVESGKILELQVLENLMREDISPLEEARAFQFLMKTDGLDLFASKINKSKKYVLDRVKLLDLCGEALNALEMGILPLGHAVLLSKIEIEKQEKVIKASNLFAGQTIMQGTSKMYCTKTLNQLKEYIAGTMLSFDRVNFDLGNAKLLTAAGSCQACPKRTINQNLLFGDITENDMCTDSFCFDAKIKQQVEVNIEKAKEEFGDVQTAETDKWSSNIILSDTKEKVSYNNKKTERYTLPVVITKTDNYAQKDMGRTVWIEDKSNQVEPEPKKEIVNNWETNQAKQFNDLTIPRFQKVISALREAEDCKYDISNIYLVEQFANVNMELLLVVAHFLGIRPIESLNYVDIKDFTRTTTKEQDYEICLEIGQQMIDTFTNELAISILAVVDIIDDEFELNETPGEYDLTIKKIFHMLDLPIDNDDTKEIEVDNDSITEVEDNEPIINKFDELSKELNDKSVKLKESLTDWNPSKINGDPSNLTKLLNKDSQTETIEPRFEKIKKKYALNNSYFKNHRPQDPKNPSEIMQYFDEHNELPFDNGADTSKWLYECYIEFQKRNNVYHSQYFTPPATADQMRVLAHEYFDKEKIVLDACCGFGALSKPLIEDEFKVVGFDFSVEMVQLYNDQYIFDTVDPCENINFMEGEFVKKYYNIISNPPYEVPALTKFLDCVYENLIDGGTAILLIPKEFVDKEKPKALASILSNFILVHRQDMDEDFARTGVKAEIVVLRKA